MSTTDRGRVVRERLLAAAVDLIAERGWTAVTTRVLAERAGVTPGLVHYHFASLSRLLAEAGVGVVRDALVGIRAAFDAADTPLRIIRVLLDAMDGLDEADVASPVFSETYLAAVRDPALRAQVTALLSDFVSTLTERFALAGVPDAAGTAAVVTATMDGLILHRSLTAPPDRATTERVLTRLIAPEATT
ncbi:TetR/AcrR family transcriptional regulator [Stackebrandtia soli]|uniref:TetR/AcrR family transcriptional regulator n=1 Tax=Stackebrandtia soli TaxID=1892856 RepID=UPI0039ECAA74